MTPERRERVREVLDHRQADLTIVMENIFDPHNISAVLRSCDAVGIASVHVVNTREPNHLRYEHYSSASAGKWIPIHEHNSAKACVSALRQQGFRILTTHLHEKATDLYTVNFLEPVALVFGNEKLGVSAEMRKLADGNMLIPQMGMIRSLNISVACAVSIFEAMRQKLEAGHYSSSRLSTKDRDALLAHWGESRLTAE